MGSSRVKKKVEAINKFEGFGMLVEKKNTKVNNFVVEALQSIAWVIRALCLYKKSNINEKGVEDYPNSFLKIVYEAKETLEKIVYSWMDYPIWLLDIIDTCD